jgi:4-amino-4-deoxy-L-arabinose transferase-like glycosyltransferase
MLEKIISKIDYYDWCAILILSLLTFFFLRILLLIFFEKKDKRRKIIFSLVVIFLIVLAWFFLLVLFPPQQTYYGGSKNLITGEWCDFGFNPGTKDCCDEDDYTCEVCSGYNKNYSCGDFLEYNKNLYNTAQEASQDIYEMCSSYNPKDKDVFNLDLDEDGVACESLTN